MKYIKYLFLITCIVLISCNNKDSKVQISQESISSPKNIVSYRDITVDELETAFGSEDYVLIDVRTPEEIANGMIEGAKHIDYVSNDFEDQIKKLDRNSNYVIYCRSGGRSTKASKMMEDLGFKQVVNLEGGYLAYTDSQ